MEQWSDIEGRLSTFVAFPFCECAGQRLGDSGSTKVCGFRH